MCIRHSHTDADTYCEGYPASFCMLQIEKKVKYYVTSLCTFGFNSSHHVSVNLTLLLSADFFQNQLF